MGIHIVDGRRFKSCHRQCFGHRQEGTLTVVARSGLVEGVTGIAIAAEFTDHRCPSALSRLGRFQHEIRGSFSEVQSGTRSVEWPALLMVEDHQRVETVEVELRDTLRTAYDSYLRQSGPNQVGSEDDGIGCRRAGRGDGGLHGDVPRVLLCNHVGTGTAVVQCNVFIALVVL